MPGFLVFHFFDLLYAMKDCAEAWGYKKEGRIHFSNEKRAIISLVSKSNINLAGH